MRPARQDPTNRALDDEVRLSELVETVERTHEVVTLVRHGRETAVLMAKEDLDSLHETPFWLSQPEVRRDIEAARAELERGETTPGDEWRAGFRPRE